MRPSLDRMEISLGTEPASLDPAIVDRFAAVTTRCGDDARVRGEDAGR